MAERKVSVRLAVVDGGRFKAEMAGLGATGSAALTNLGATAEGAGKGVHLTTQQLASLQFQLQDVMVGLSSGQNPFTVMLQQGSQIVQMFKGGTGILGAIKAVGTGLISFLTNPLNLALLGFAAATAAADALFSSVAGPGEEANKTLEDQQAVIGKIAEKYGAALPQVKAYADAIARATELADLAEGQGAALTRAWSNATTIFDASQNQILQIFADLQMLGDIDTLARLQHQVWGLDEALQHQTATAEQAKRIQGALLQLFQTTGIPATEALARRFGSLAAAIAGATAEAGAIAREFGQNIPASGVLAALDTELANLGKSAEALRIEKELRQANVAAASAEGQAIAAKVRQIFAEQTAQKDAAAAERDAASVARQARQQAAREAARQQQSVQELIASLKEEIAIAQTFDPVHQELIRRRDQLAGATAAERAEIEALIRQKITLHNIETIERPDPGQFGPAIDYLHDFVKQAGTAGDLIKETLSGAFAAVGEAVSQFVETGKVKFTSLVTAILADVARLSLQQALAPIATLLAGAFGSIAPSQAGGGLGGLLASVFHDGGLAGGASPLRQVPVFAFADAPRLHGGGLFAPDEIPAILQRGERVLSRRETQNYDRNRGTPAVQIIDQRVNAPPLRQEQGLDGSLRVIVRDELRRSIALGEQDGAMASRFAVAPRKTVR